MGKTATKEQSASQEPSSVLTELGLGNSLKPAKESTDESAVVDQTGDAATAPTKPADQPSPAESNGKPKGDAAAQDQTAHTDGVEADKAERSKLEKQLKDTRNAFTQERQQNKQLQAHMKSLEQQIGILTKKIDGTYDEEKDGQKPPSLDDTKQSERVATSHWAAVDRYGEEYVMQTIWADDAPFRQFDHDPAVQARVLASKTPILEAIKVVKEAEGKQKWGNDPEAWFNAKKDALREEIEKEVRQKIIKEYGRPSEETVKGLGGARQASETKPDQNGRLNFEGLFPGFQKTAG